MAQTKFKLGQQVYLLSSNTIREGIVWKLSNGFYTIKFKEGGGIRVRESRLFLTKEEAEANIKKYSMQDKYGRYDY